MKKFISYIVIAFFAAITISFADDKATCMANENAAWQAYKDRKADDLLDPWAGETMPHLPKSKSTQIRTRIK